LSASAKQRALAWLRTGFALALLAFGAHLIPWKDTLVCMGGPQKLELSGAITGGWREDSIQFLPDPGQALIPGWPADVAAGVASGKPFAVVRTAETTGPHVDWKPGMLRVFREVDLSLLCGAGILVLSASIVAITRWWRLLSVAGCGTRWSSAFRLSFVGFFFNVVLPAGITGGDVIKAVLVVREHPERRADAFVTVVVDRAIGLLVLMGLAAIVVLVSGGRFAELQLPVVGSFLAALIVLWVMLHPGPRRWLRLASLLERMPQKERLKSVDRALRIYSENPLELLVAVVLSAGNHLCIGGAVYLLGHAFGDHARTYLEYLGVAAIANTISSVPVTPSGWGVGEWAFGSLFHILGSPSTLGVAVSVAYRLLTMLLGLAGGLFLLMPGGRGVRREIDRTATEAPAA
jgi:hypothetical protein